MRRAVGLQRAAPTEEAELQAVGKGNVAGNRKRRTGPLLLSIRYSVSPNEAEPVCKEPSVLSELGSSARHRDQLSVTRAAKFNVTDAQHLPASTDKLSAICLILLL